MLKDLITTEENYNYAFLDEGSKREIRRSLLKAVAIPGYQVPFGSRELPIGRGWGTGGLQITLSLIGQGDIVKVIDQGTDAGVNAANIRRLIERTAPDVTTTFQTSEATIIQTRHRIPEEKMQAGQLLVLQVPLPEPLRLVERSENATRRMHADKNYSRMWVALYEEIVKHGLLARAYSYPVMVNGRYVMAPSPIPRWDVEKLHNAEHLSLFGAGREKRLYAVPPRTAVIPLDFEDYPFSVEDFHGMRCQRCGAEHSFLDEITTEAGQKTYMCSDTAYCDERFAKKVAEREIQKEFAG
jgi:alpha-D-ribose 1-methylphosphonate 5-phosphate C-P lyase